MATRPTVGGSDGTWGTELNAHLDISLDDDGKVDDGAAQTTSAAPGADAELTNKKYQDDHVGHDGDGYVLRDVDGTPVKVYTKYLTGTFDAASTKNVVHGITGVDKILDVRVVAFSTNGYYVAQNTFGAASPTIAFQVTFDGTNIIFQAIGSTIQSQKYRIRIDYIT